jgi:Xaa-Pro aminopeptidase
MEQAAKECPDFEVVDMMKEGYLKILNNIIKEEKVQVLGFEDTISFKEYETLKEGLQIKELQKVSGLVENIRMIKDDEELKCLKTAVEIGDAAFKYLLSYIRPGVTEMEVALELEYFMKKQGASKLSFDSIVASGLHSSMPHAQPTNKEIEKGDFLTLDFGCIYNGYCSDMTRTIVMGHANEKQKNIYNTVLEAQLKALNTIQAGLTGKEADKSARDVIHKAGYGDYFGHGLGHAVGLYIHEEPRLSPSSTHTLLENMVVTVEPGIYVAGFGGVRIEDLVIVNDKGILNYTESPKELIELE